MDIENKGKFIVFEGIDGSGQSTQAQLLDNFLKDNGLKVICTKEPTKESEIGKRIRAILKGEQIIEPRELQKLFVEDREWHLENIVNPSLNRGEMVICDRYLFSTIAFGGADGLDKNWLWQMNKDFLMPDLLFFIKTSPVVAMTRIDKRDGGKRQLFEKQEKLERAFHNYQDIFQQLTTPPFYEINGEVAIEEVFEQIKNIIIKYL